MFCRPEIFFLVSLLFVALLNSIPTYLLNFEFFIILVRYTYGWFLKQVVAITRFYLVAFLEAIIVFFSIPSTYILLYLMINHVCGYIHSQQLFVKPAGLPPGFLKLLLSGKSVCVCVSAHQAIKNYSHETKGE